MSEFRVGDMFVERGTSLGAKLICLGTKSRFNHAGLIVSAYPGGYKTLEAAGRGATWRHLPRDGAWSSVVVGVRVPLSDAQRNHIPYIARTLHGIPYSKRGLVAIGIAQFGITWPAWVKRRLNDRSDLFCSQLVDLAYNLAGFKLYDDGRLSGDVSPGDLGALAFERGWRSAPITRVA